MNEIASPGQLRMSLFRWMLVCIPGIVGIGSIIGITSNSGYSNAWFVALDRPDLVPPGWVFGVAWTALYTMMGVALAIIIDARGAIGRGKAIALFLVQLAANFAWTPLFFGMRQISSALMLIAFILIAAIATAIVFGRIRRLAGVLLVPYVAWLMFASYLNFEIDRRNPDGETLVPPAASANIQLR